MKTKEDVKKSLSDYSVLLINKFVAVGLLLISIPLLTRILGKTGYGQFSLPCDKIFIIHHGIDVREAEQDFRLAERFFDKFNLQDLKDKK